MKIPVVNDQMLDKILESASSPVAVIFTGSPDRSREAFWAWRMSEIADDWDNRVIFIKVSVAENPVMCRSLGIEAEEGGLIGMPCLTVFVRAKAVGTAEDCSRLTIEALFNEAIRVRK